MFDCLDAARKGGTHTHSGGMTASGRSDSAHSFTDCCRCTDCNSRVESALQQGAKTVTVTSSHGCELGKRKR